MLRIASKKRLRGAGEERGEGGRPLALSAGSGRSPLNAIYVEVCVARQTDRAWLDGGAFLSDGKVHCPMTQSWMNMTT